MNSKPLTMVQEDVWETWPDCDGWFTAEQLRVQLQTLNALARKGYLEVDDRDYYYAWGNDNGLVPNAKVQVKFRRKQG